MKEYTNEYLDYLETKLKEYLLEVRPKTFSWGNKKDIDALIKWLENK